MGAKFKGVIGLHDSLFNAENLEVHGINLAGSAVSILMAALWSSFSPS